MTMHGEGEFDRSIIYKGSYRVSERINKDR